MAKKVVIAHDDFAVTKTLCEEYFGFLEEYGYETVYVSDYKGLTLKDSEDLMMLTEKNKPEDLQLNQDLLREVADAEILIVHFSIVNKELLDAAKCLKVLGVCRGGMNNVNVTYAKERGIQVYNSASRSSNAVADFTVALAIAEVRNLVRASMDMRNGRVTKNFLNYDSSHDMRNMTVGVIGYGLIGRRVIERFKAFGAKIIVYDPYLSEQVISDGGETPVSLETLLTTADIITIHLRHSETTHHFLNRERLEMIKPTAFLVNTARAGLIDEEALYELLDAHKIMGAALDVFTDEPLRLDSPFYKLDNLTMTPHIAGMSCDTITNSVELMQQAILDYIKKDTE